LLAGDYDIAALMADQAVQLCLKSAIFRVTGEIPRVHPIRQLFHIFGTAIDRLDEVEEFIRKSRSLLIRLEDAYINSHCIPREYERDEAGELVTFAEEAVEFVKNLERKASA
jgi:HEPN domain-containing protein